MGFELDPLGDIIAEDTAKNARVCGKFQPKAKQRPSRKDSAATSASSLQPVPTSDVIERESSVILNPDKPSEHCFHRDDQRNSISVILSSQNIVTIDRPNTTAGLVSDPDVVMPDGKCSWQSNFNKSGEDSQSIPSEINFGDKCSNPAFPQDDVLDLSAVGFTRAIPSESMPELIVDENPINLVETSQLNSGLPGCHPEVVPEMPAELSRARTRKGKTRTSIPSPEQQNASTSGQKNEAGRSLRPRKNTRNLFHLVDEFDDEFHVDGEFPAECPSSSVVGEDNISDKKFQVKNESQTKKVKRNSVKPIGDKEKPAGKRKKAKETSDQPAKSKPRKFSHSTLKRRQVDKVLLETPEDEIDFQKVPFRDVILLAEQLQKKEATTGVPSTNQSNVNPLDGEYDHGQESHRVEESNIYSNYQTYMKRTPRVRWSKQDTELFYEAIQQFGTDFSMILLLFLGRTRNQVMLNYKKEERKHPMRLHDALTARAKDHSHFKKVIEHLQQIAAEENQNGNKDDSINLTGNEDAEEGSREANKGEPKTEREGAENEDTAQEFTEIQSPMKSCDSEDDLYLWSQYKSDI